MKAKSVLVIGLGRFGRHLANKMRELGNDVMIVDKDEKLVGYGTVHTAEGGLTLPVGANRIYAEILSEVNVQQLTCQIEQVSPFNPA